MKNSKVVDFLIKKYNINEDTVGEQTAVSPEELKAGYEKTGAALSGFMSDFNSSKQAPPPKPPPPPPPPKPPSLSKPAERPVPVGGKIM